MLFHGLFLLLPDSEANLSFSSSHGQHSHPPPLICDSTSTCPLSCRQSTNPILSHPECSHTLSFKTWQWPQSPFFFMKHMETLHPPFLWSMHPSTLSLTITFAVQTPSLHHSDSQHNIPISLPSSPAHPPSFLLTVLRLQGMTGCNALQLTGP